MKLRIKLIITLIVLTIVPLIHGQNTGTVEIHSFISNALGINKNFYIYLPAGYDSSTTRYPVVYFLRSHEIEWFAPNAPGRNGTSLKDVADSLIANGHIGKMILVGPSTGGAWGEAALVNMLRPDLAAWGGIGSGRFEDYFVEDLIPEIDSNFRTVPDREHRGIDGFSLGGYSALVYSLRNPELFSSVGSYDGSMMWYNLDDPEISGNGPDDWIWMNPPPPYDQWFNSIFDSPRNIPYMLQHNPTNILVDANAAKLDSIRSIRFHIHSVHSVDPDSGNHTRNLQFVDSLAARGIFNTFSDITLAPGARHDYGYADIHASKSLIKHWETFQKTTSINDNIAAIPNNIELFQNYPNPFNPSTTIKYGLKERTNVELKIFDIIGREVETLVNEERTPGTYESNWNAANLPSGIYFYRLQAGSFVETKKMVLLK